MKKTALLLLCLMLFASVVGCDYYDDYYYDDGYYYDNDNDDYEYYNDYDNGNDYQVSDQGEEVGTRAQPGSGGELSAEDFIADVKTRYGVTLEDPFGFLSGAGGPAMIAGLDRGLVLYSSGFMTKMVGLFAEYGSNFIIRLEGESEDAYGTAEWDNDLIVILHFGYDEDNGITLETLAHELAHAVQFLVQENIGEEQYTIEMMRFNGSFTYVGDDHYEAAWVESLHSTTFASDYGMSCCCEDWATIIEFMVKEPQAMYERFKDSDNEPLFLKAQWIRTMFYQHVSNEAFLLFEPLYNAEQSMRAAA